MDKQILDVTRLWEEYNRLKQENEKLKKYIKDLQGRKDRYYLQALEYEKALEEIIYLLKTEEPFCYCSCGDELIDKINEVLE